MSNSISDLKARIEKFVTWDDYNVEDRIKKYDSFYLNILTEYHVGLQEYNQKEDDVDDWIQEQVEAKITSGEAVSARAAEEILKKTKSYKLLKRELRKQESYVNYMKDAVTSVKNFSFSLGKYLDRKKMIEGM